MPRLVTVAATQMSCSWDRQANIARAEKLVRQAAAQGAQIILIQELFETPYFCQKPNPEYLQMATPTDEDRKSTRLNSSHVRISYAVFCLKKKKICNNKYM